MSLLPSKFGTVQLHPPNPIPIPIRALPHPRRQTLRILSGKRAGKQRYPSERKVLKLKHKEIVGNVNNKYEGIWRLSKLGVPVDRDPGKDFLGVSDSLLEQIAKVLEFPVSSMLPSEAFTVVRKSFDARKRLKEPKFVYIVEMDVDKLLRLEPRAWDFISELEPKVGLVEHMPQPRKSGDLTSIIHDLKVHEGSVSRESGHTMLNGSQGSIRRINELN